ncbi:hypothetical protein SHO565_13570 [Streptomyces sp. HO565]
MDETAGKTDQDKVDEVAKTEATENTAVDGDSTAVEDPAVDEAGAGTYADAGAVEKDGPTGVGQGAGAVVSAGLGIVSLTGSWVGTVASAREAVFGQLETTQSSNVQTMLEKGYGDAWQATALWGGAFALVALIVGVVVLVRPAFGAPGKPQAAWIKSVSWAGVALGVIGLILAVLKYTDVMMAVPSVG